MSEAPSSVALQVAWLFPGQGSQVVGMGHDLCAQFAPARDVLRRASEMADYDLVSLVMRGPDDLLTRTDNLQPAITAVTMGCCLYLQERGLRPDFVAGHSLGEYAALFAAGVLGLEDTLRLVIARGRLMHEAAQGLDGGMLAVSDLKLAEIEAVLHGTPVTIANQNAPSQVAVCGPRTALPAVAVALTAAGGRATPLNVSGPWHSPQLAPAAERFAVLLDATPFATPQVGVAMNTTGTIEHGADAIRAAMQRQLCSPVRWQAGMVALHEAGAARFVEVGPKKVLRGLLRHIPQTQAAEAANFDGPRTLRFVERLYQPAVDAA